MAIFNSISTTILQVIRFDLVQQTDTAAFLTQVQQYASTFFSNTLQRFLQLKATITTQREQRIAGQTLGVNTRQRWRV